MQELEEIMLNDPLFQDYAVKYYIQLVKEHGAKQEFEWSPLSYFDWTKYSTEELSRAHEDLRQAYNYHRYRDNVAGELPFNFVSVIEWLEKHDLIESVPVPRNISSLHWKCKGLPLELAQNPDFLSSLV